MFWKVIDFIINTLEKIDRWCLEATTAKKRLRRMPIAVFFSIVKLRLFIPLLIFISVATFFLSEEDNEEICNETDPIISELNDFRKKMMDV